MHGNVRSTVNTRMTKDPMHQQPPHLQSRSRSGKGELGRAGDQIVVWKRCGSYDLIITLRVLLLCRVVGLMDILI